MELGCAATVHGKRLTALDSSASSLSFLERDRSPALQESGILNGRLRLDAKFLNREGAML